MTDYPQYPLDPNQPGGGAQPSSGQGPRPQPVDLAVKLIWIMIGLSVVGALVTFVSLDSIVDQALEDAGVSESLDAGAVRTGAVMGAVVGLVISVGLYALLAVFIGKGANWARIVYTVLAGLGIALSLLGFLTGGVGGQPILLTLISLVSLGLTIWVLALLWSSESSGWFKQPRSPVA
ncbi:hypothetical protein [Nocardioides coralli]|uniref:hypothetical protein n=1 Tax=Nocardioides coralli TaxID=2872154 RepID=UPI001CA435B8|nr:hypothetical protein [Nocardioides coralli]QZY28260.1 hypothetical protein K6T13_12315 [Nocardioides coralli]